MRSKPHYDINNVGLSYGVCFGQYTGGELFVQDDCGSSRHKLEEDVAVHNRVRHRRGDEVVGDAHAVHLSEQQLVLRAPATARLLLGNGLSYAWLWCVVWVGVGLSSTPPHSGQAGRSHHRPRIPSFCKPCNEALLSRSHPSHTSTSKVKQLMSGLRTNQTVRQLE